MDSLLQLIDQIPIRHDLASSIIFSGLLVAILIVVVVFLRADIKNQAIRIFGFLILAELLIGIDGYLCYTGLIKHALHLNDTTEPIVLLIGPLIYLFTRSIVTKDNFKIRWDILHFLLPFIYFLTQTIYYIQPLDLKYNAYAQAYHPGLPIYESSYSTLFLFSDAVKDYLRWFIVASFGVYLLLAIRLYFKKNDQESSSLNLGEKRYLFSMNLLLLIFLVLLLIVVVFMNFQTDLGDHYITIFFTLINFVAAGFIMSESRFFERSWVADKYDTSGLNSPSDLFDKIDTYVSKEQYFLRSDTSLTGLATALSIPKNYVSQAINKEQALNFNDYINQYRIEEVKRRLSDESYKHYNIESIGESVGFNAKTTFYAAFKKHTKQTPAAYLKSL